MSIWGGALNSLGFRNVFSYRSSSLEWIEPQHDDGGGLLSRGGP